VKKDAKRRCFVARLGGKKQPKEPAVNGSKTRAQKPKNKAGNEPTRDVRNHAGGCTEKMPNYAWNTTHCIRQRLDSSFRRNDAWGEDHPNNPSYSCRIRYIMLNRIGCLVEPLAGQAITEKKQATKSDGNSCIKSSRQTG